MFPQVLRLENTGKERGVPASGQTKEGNGETLHGSCCSWENTPKFGIEKGLRRLVIRVQLLAKV